MVWYGRVWSGLVMVPFGMVGYDVVWYGGMVWYGELELDSHSGLGL